MLRDLEDARDPSKLEGLRVLLERRRFRPVSMENAQAFFDRAARKWRAQAAARQAARRDSKAVEGVCTRCKSAPARPGVNRRTGKRFTTCEACNAIAAEAVRSARARAKLAGGERRSKEDGNRAENGAERENS